MNPDVQGEHDIIIPSTEARFSASFKWQTGDGFVIIHTVRQDTEKEFQHALTSAIDYARVNGKPVVDGRDQTFKRAEPLVAAVVQAAQKSEVATSAPAPAAAAIPAPGGAPAQIVNNDGQWFDAETLSASMNNGKTYWKIKGGRFSQYGITIWPEVLSAAGFHKEALNPATVYDVKGYKAQYVLNSQGKPDKVIALIK